MTASEALERIRSLLLRTEERGASEAEENAAARLVCKLLRKFPELLSQTRKMEVWTQTVRTEPFSWTWPGWKPAQQPPEPEPTKDNSKQRGFEYRVISSTAGHFQVLIKSRNKTVWLPNEHCSFSANLIWIPIWLCKEKGLD